MIAAWAPPSLSRRAFSGVTGGLSLDQECGSPWRPCGGRMAPPASWAACCWPGNPWRGPATPSSGPAGCGCRSAHCQAAPSVGLTLWSWRTSARPSGWGRPPPVGCGWGGPARWRPRPGRWSGAAGWGNGLGPGCETRWPEWREHRDR